MPVLAVALLLDAACPANVGPLAIDLDSSMPVQKVEVIAGDTAGAAPPSSSNDFTYYINPAGKELNSGLGPLTPKVDWTKLVTITNATIRLNAGSWTLSNTVYFAPGVTLIGSGSNTVITNAMSRPRNDLQNGSLTGPAMVINNNVTIRNFRIVGAPGTNGYPQQNCPAIGTIYFDQSNPAATNVLLEEITLTNHTVGFYFRHTNACQIVIRNCDVLSQKTALLIGGGGGHMIDAYNCLFSSIGPDLLSGDPGQYLSLGVSAESGTNNFYNCRIIAANPLPAAGFTTNCIGVSVANVTGNNNLLTVVNLYSCGYGVSDTNASNTCVAIYNPVPYITNQPICWTCFSVVTNHGSYVSAFGSVLFDLVPITTGGSPVLNPNELILTNSTGSGLASGTIFTNNGGTWTDAMGFGDTITGSANNWVLSDPYNYFAPAYKNTNGVHPWQGTWFAHGAPAPVPLMMEAYAVSNTVTVVADLSLDSSGNVNVAFLSQTGVTYKLQYKNFSSDPQWLSLPNSASGTGGLLVLRDSTGVKTRRFYRVVGTFPQ
jgi:hypothetical protein